MSMNAAISKALKQSSPSKVAVRFYDGTTWTECHYEHLITNVQALVKVFKELCSDQRQCFGFCVSPFLGLPVLILSVIELSCAFIFLEPHKLLSKDSVLQQLGVQWVISDGKVCGSNLKYQRTLNICGSEISLYRNEDVNPKEHTNKCNYLYGITTSGSTGIPKIVRVPQESIIPNIADFSTNLGINSNDVILLSTALTFDPSMVEFFLGVLNSASWVVISKNVKETPILLFEAVRAGGVTFYQTTPSLFRLWPVNVKHKLFTNDSPLKSLVLGGEQFPSKTEVNSWQPSDKVRIYNTYGITEVSCWATVNLVWPNASWGLCDQGIDIGEPLSETLLKFEKYEATGLEHLLIGSMTRICSIGDESFEKLVAHKPIFRPTGDLFEVVNGKYFFRQRSDSIFKRFGKRISLSLIEETARDCGLENIVITQNYTCGSGRIILYIVSDCNSEIGRSQIQSLKEQLPADHWPDDIQSVDVLPLSSHGKIDREKLKNCHLSPVCTSKRKLFEKLWNYFTSGRLVCEQNEQNSNGFITAGGNSFSAVLFVQSLEDQQIVVVHNNLLMKLLADVSFEECLKEFEDDTVSSVLPSIATEPATKSIIKPVLNESSSEDVIMMLKGRIWPGSVTSCFNGGLNEDIHVELDWKVDLMKCVDASPLGVVMDAKSFLIVGSHSGIVVVLHPDSGRILTRTQLPDRVEASACLSTDKLHYYIGCYNGNVYKICLKDGAIMWNFSTCDIVKSTCALYNGRIMFGSYDKHVYAVTENGDLTWKQNVGPVTTSIVIYQSTALVGSLSGMVISLNAENGVINWQINIGPALFSNLLVTSYNNHGDCLVICPVNGHIQWRDVNTSNEIFNMKLPGTIFASPVPVLKDSLLIPSGNILYCIQSEVLWTQTFTNRIVSTPFIIGNYIMVITTDGGLSVLDSKNGSIRCTYHFPGEVFSSPVMIGSRLFVGCRDNNFYSLKFT